MKPIIAFCGPIGSGKSSVSKLFARQLGAKWSSFGGITREIAKERNVPELRENLQMLGAHLIEHEREMFCKRVLAAINGEEYGVIDGLRHAYLFHELQTFTKPRQILCVYVDVSTEIRRNRVHQRDGINADALAKLDEHSTELQVQNELLKLANLKANNNRTPEECVAEILKWVHTQ